NQLYKCPGTDAARLSNRRPFAQQHGHFTKRVEVSFGNYEKCGSEGGVRPHEPHGGASPVEKLQPLPEVARRRDHRQKQQKNGWEVFDRNPETIAFHAGCLQLRRRPRRGRVVVPDAGSRGISASPPGPRGAQPEVSVLAIEKEVTVERSDLFQHLPPVQSSAAARKQDIPRSGE